MRSKNLFPLFINRSSAVDFPAMSNHLHQGVERRLSIPFELLSIRNVPTMLLELGAQIHSLQLFGRSKGCLSSGVKVRRNVPPPTPYSLEVVRRQLVVEILLQSEIDKLAKCRDYHA